MSINSMANAAAARRPDMFPFNATPKNLDEIAQAHATPPQAAAPGDGTPAPVAGSGNIETALNVLFGYIPTEVLTLYVAVLATIGTPGKVAMAEWVAFWAFLVATPVVVWLVYGAKMKNAGKPVPLAVRAWPMWEMSAATLAFLAWSFALPETPFTEYAWYSPALAGVIVLVTSTVLGLVAPFFQQPLQPNPVGVTPATS